VITKIQKHGEEIIVVNTLLLLILLLYRINTEIYYITKSPIIAYIAAVPLLGIYFLYFIWKYKQIGGE